MSSSGASASSQTVEPSAPADTDREPEKEPEQDPEAIHRARLQGMLGNPVFLEGITLQLARELKLEGSVPYFLEILREGEGAPRVRDVVQLAPEAVEALVASGEWLPQDRKEWKWLVFTALREDLYPSMPTCLELALDVEDSPVRWISAGLSFRPDALLYDVLRDGFRNDDANNRAYSATAACANGYEDYIASVRALLDDLHPWVRANAMAGLIVLDDLQGIEAARDLLFLPAATKPQVDISMLFEALERAAPNPNALAFVREVLPKLEGIDRVAAESILVLHDGRTETLALREALLDLDPMVPEVHRAVRALSATLSDEDVRVLVDLFHRANTQTVAVDLVVALAKSGYREVEPLLQRAAFTLPWNQGLLAAGAAFKVFGEGSAFEWVRDAPDGTPAETFRRIGWAVATFGGAEAARLLRERAASPEAGLPPERRSAVLQGASLALLEAAGQKGG